MRALDPDAGIAERFACELRALRAVAGEPPFWKMALRCQVSKSALAAAVDGRVLPSENVVREFVGVCRGDWQWWSDRLLQAREQLEASRAADELPVADTESAALVPVSTRRVLPVPLTEFWPGTTKGLVSRAGQAEPGEHADAAVLGRLRKRTRIISGFAVLETAVIVALIVFGMVKAGPAPVAIEDGTDPKAVNCGADAKTIDSSPVVLGSAVTIDGKAFRAGSALGVVTLRYSAHCNGAWARFDPTEGVFGNPDQGTVTIQAARPAEGAQSSWRLGHIDQTYSDLLLTGMGCVVASATVNVGPATATGTTQCRPTM
jgi:hypothetical protein